MSGPRFLGAVMSIYVVLRLHSLAGHAYGALAGWASLPLVRLVTIDFGSASQVLIASSNLTVRGAAATYAVHGRSLLQHRLLARSALGAL